MSAVGVCPDFHSLLSSWGPDAHARKGGLASRCTCHKAAWLRALSPHGSHDHGPISICVNLR